MQLLADAIEVDNSSTESANAALRRKVKQVLQQRALELADLSSHWIYGDCRTEASWLGGTPVPTAAAAGIDSQEGTSPAMSAGGGGLSRCFMSTYKDRFKNDRNQVMLSEVQKAYKHESEKESSDMLDAIRDEAKKGTVSYREKFKHDGGHAKGLLSSFGAFRSKRPAVTQEGVRRAKMLLDDMHQALDARQHDVSVGAVVVVVIVAFALGKRSCVNLIEQRLGLRCAAGVKVALRHTIFNFAAAPFAAAFEEHGLVLHADVLGHFPL